MKKLLHRKSSPPPAGQTLRGQVRRDARTKNLTPKLQIGEVAVIDHQDLDRIAAEALAAARPVAVLNAAKSCSSRFPNLGPEVLIQAGIALIDDLGPAVMELGQGDKVEVLTGSGQVKLDGRTIATGQVQTEQSVAHSMALARRGLKAAMTDFAANTMTYLEGEYEQFFDHQDLPEIKTDLAGRPVLVVVRGYHYIEDLAVLKPYVSEAKPVIIGVDGGADAVIEAGLKPDMVVGDMDSVGDKALSCGAELVLHAYRDGRAPGARRLERLGLEFVTLPAPGTSEDVALMIADDKGAELIVAVGTHMTLVEFLDKGREGMASTFLTRLRVGGKLVDAKGVSQLYRRGVSNLQIVALCAAGLVTLLAALGATPVGHAFFEVIGASFDDAWAWIKSVMPG
ncbi:MAG: putative cytokinetic ring protein SteA [Micrococcales bacterium]|nr:putative cytokinetic ring protein SteA [Micrococcales bacterium]